MQVDRTRMYRVSDVAELLDVSKSTVYRAIEAGDLDALRIGSAVRIPGASLAGWLDQCVQAAYEHHVLAGEPVEATDQATDRGEPVEVAPR
jgi:excisionase family DNA binding protein